MDLHSCESVQKEKGGEVGQVQRVLETCHRWAGLSVRVYVHEEKSNVHLCVGQTERQE